MFCYNCHSRYDARDRAVSTVERLHIGGDRWEHVADMNKVCDWSKRTTT